MGSLYSIDGMSVAEASVYREQARQARIQYHTENVNALIREFNTNVEYSEARFLLDANRELQGLVANRNFYDTYEELLEDWDIEDLEDEKKNLIGFDSLDEFSFDV